MSIRDMKWSPTEKKVARAAFDLAYDREMEEIKNTLREKIKQLESNENVWQLEKYLSNRRKIIDRKYDYRYSMLILVFGKLLEEGYLLESDITELSDDKITAIKNVSK
jgi:hypothetical protein